MFTRHCLKAAALSLALTPFVFTAGAALSKQAQAEVNFSGKRIVWIVSAREGGGSDNFTRSIAKYYTKHLPGNPKIVVRNIPGTGGIPGHNHFMNQAKDDGLMLITLSTSAIFNQVLKNPAVKYDVAKYKTVLCSPLGAFIYASPQTGVKSSDDVKMLIDSKKNYRFGGYGPTSAEMRMLVMWHFLGVGIKPLWGLSRGKVRQAFMRNEVDVNYDTASSWLKKVKPLVDKGEAVALFTFGVQNDNDEFVRDPTAPNIPHFNEVYQKIYGKPLEGRNMEVWTTLFNLSVMTSKSINLHPSTKQDVYDTYVAASKKIFADPSFKKVRYKEIGNYDVQFGAAAEKRVERAANWKPETRQWVKTFLKKYYDVDVNI
jgi:tripartite-type tricarboxylate transporter receptor subunit TctC